MGTRYAAGKKALGLCDICGQQYLLKQLKAVVVKGKRSGLLSCPTCWDPDHPQLKLGEKPVYDPQALRNPRPDTVELTAVRALFIAATGVQGFGRSGRTRGEIS